MHGGGLRRGVARRLRIYECAAQSQSPHIGGDRLIQFDEPVPKGEAEATIAKCREQPPAGLRRRKPERYVAPVNKHLAKCEWHTGATNTEQRRCAERRDRRFPCADYVHDTAAVDPCGKPSIYEWFFAHPGGASCAGGFFGRDQQHCYTLRDSLGRWGKFYPHQRDGNG